MRRRVPDQREENLDVCFFEKQKNIWKRSLGERQRTCGAPVVRNILVPIRDLNRTRLFGK